MYALEGSTEIVTYEKINLEAMRLKATSCLYMWYLLRANDPKGKGYVDYQQFFSFLKSIGLDRNTFYYATDNPCSSVFYRVNKKAGIIEYNGIKNVAKQLNVKPGNTILLFLPLIKTLSDFKAYAYAGLFANKDNKSRIVSRNKIEVLTGRSRTTQIKYEKIANVEVTPNMASINVPYNIQNNLKLVEEFINTLPCKEYFHSVSNGNVYFQLPNSYRCTNVRIPKGKKHRANKLVKITQDDGIESNTGRAGSSCVFFPYVKQNAGFTNERDCYIRTSDTANTPYGLKAKLYRYNFMSPTKDESIILPNYKVDQYKVIRYSMPVYNPFIKEEELA